MAEYKIDTNKECIHYKRNDTFKKCSTICDGTFCSPEVLDSHPEHRQLVQLPRIGMTHGDHRRQFCDVRVHLVSTSLFDFAVILSATKKLSVDLCPRQRKGKNGKKFF